jgi:hypothetical protein
MLTVVCPSRFNTSVTGTPSSKRNVACARRQLGGISQVIPPVVPAARRTTDRASARRVVDPYTQTPRSQICPASHASPQAPQLFGSRFKFRQTPLQQA